MRRKNILLYSHDTYGLGHLRRSLAIAHSISQHIPHSRQLLVTGSTVAGAFGLPPRLDMVKLPSLSKRSSGEYMARTLPLDLEETIRWRSDMILQAAAYFRPDLVLVDKAPSGVRGELLPTLDYLKTELPDTHIVLGMRDIEDSPEITRAEWTANGVYPLLEDVYDDILLYGQRSVFDPVSAYGLSAAVENKMVECGYISAAKINRPVRTLRNELGIGDQPFILVTAGGGGDGYPLLDQALRVFELGHGTGFEPLFVTGPLMPQNQRMELDARAQACGVRLLEFTPDLTRYLAAADLVVSMAGYNTVCEILTHEKRALLYPRTQVREEQRIRARSLDRLGLARMLEPETLTAEVFYHQLCAALAAPRPKTELKMDGVGRATRALTRFLRTGRALPVPLHQPPLAVHPGSASSLSKPVQETLP